MELLFIQATVLPSHKMWYVICTECEISVLSTKLHKVYAFDEDLIWPDAEEAVDSVVIRVITFPISIAGHSVCVHSIPPYVGLWQ